MRKLYKICWLLPALLVGCNRQDTEALQRINQKVVSRAEAVTGEVKSTTTLQWQPSQDWKVEARVAARLRWDKQLADVPIEVTAVGNVVEVRGKVRNLEQRRRVVMLAESTTGVEGVRDLLVDSER
jgi:osmotically-inducible protein OsmY